MPVVSGLTISQGEVVLRLLLTVLLCGAIGLEREVRDQPAGFRTHILVGLGAALFTLVSGYGFAPFTEAAMRSGSGVTFDPTRIAAQVVTGVGFLGAGAIIRQGRDVRGLTTAASLWTVASIGLAVAAGYLLGAVAATLISIGALFVLRYFRGSVIGRLRLDYADLHFTLKDPATDPRTVLEILDSHGIGVRRMDLDLDEERASYRLQVRSRPPHNTRAAMLEVLRLPEVEKVSASGLREAEAPRLDD